MISDFNTFKSFSICSAKFCESIFCEISVIEFATECFNVVLNSETLGKLFTHNSLISSISSFNTEIVDCRVENYRKLNLLCFQFVYLKPFGKPHQILC